MDYKDSPTETTESNMQEHNATCFFLKSYLDNLILNEKMKINSINIKFNLCVYIIFRFIITMF